MIGTVAEAAAGGVVGGVIGSVERAVEGFEVGSKVANNWQQCVAGSAQGCVPHR